MSKEKEKKEKEEESPQVKRLRDLHKRLQKEVSKEISYEIGSIERIKLDSVDINNALGGGLPRGLITEIGGDYSSGKTTLSFEFINAFLREDPNNAAMFIDAEHALSRDYMEALIGENMDRVLIIQPLTIEEVFKSIIIATESGVGLVVVDSVAAMMSAQEFGHGVDNKVIGTGARSISQGMKHILGPLRKTNTSLILLNQLRNKIGVMFGNPLQTTGGKAVEFYSSVRAMLTGYRAKSGQEADSSGEVVSNQSILRIEKNKTAPPFRETEKFSIEYGKGIDFIQSNVELAIKEGLIEQGGAWYSVPLKNGEIERLQGRDNVYRFYKDEKNLEEYLYIKEGLEQNYY